VWRIISLVAIRFGGFGRKVLFLDERMENWITLPTEINDVKRVAREVWNKFLL